MTTMGQKIEELRIAKGLSKESLAKSSNVALATINNVISGRHKLIGKNVKKIADALGVSALDLYSESDLIGCLGKDPISIIKRECLRLGISQTELADMSGLGSLTVRKMMNGTKEPRPSNIIKIAEALNIPLQRFFSKNGMTTMGQKIEELRIAKGLSKESLAKSSNVALETINNVISGRHKLIGKNVKKIADALGVSALDLYSESDLIGCLGKDPISIIKRECLRLGISQTELADMSGLGILTVRKMMNGTNEPRPSNIIKIAEALNIPLQRFFSKE